MKRLVYTLLCVLSAAAVEAADPSTPIDGNLYRSAGIRWLPSKVVVYPDAAILKAQGLRLEGGRIFKASAEGCKAIGALPDINAGADVSAAADGTCVVLTGNSRRYRHGIFGDDMEATGFAVVRNGEIVANYELPPHRVFETLRAVIADIVPENEGDEIILTASDQQSGSRIELFSMQAAFLGASDPVGQGFRWLHLLAAAPFGPGPEIYLAAVKTPHIGGVLQFYAWDGRKLVVAGAIDDVSTHRIGSDNLNMAVAADFDGVPGSELMLPASDFKCLKIVKHVGPQARVVSTFDLPEPLATNIYLDMSTPPAIWIGTQKGPIVSIK